MPTHEIRTLDDPRLDPYRNLKQTNLARDGGLFIAEGILVAERLLASDFRTVSVLVSERRRHAIENRVPASVDLFIVPQEVGEQLVGFNFHAGVLACGVRKPAAALETVARACPDRAIIVACSGVNDPDNLGTIIRLSAGFSVNAILLGPGCSDPFSRRVLRVSMGNAFLLPILETSNLLASLAQLRSQDHFDVVGTVLRDGEPLPQASRSSRTVLLFGNEASGLSESEIAACDRRVTIPIAPAADSLNVATAATICLYHFTRVV